MVITARPRDPGPVVENGNSDRPQPTGNESLRSWDASAFCRLNARLFDSLARSDQRRHAEKYVRGLLSADGRRSIRNIARPLGDSALEQSLHHFICSSTWDWRPVREALTQYVMDVIPTRAWVGRSMFIPKAGHTSVGVERQYVPETRQMLNAQQAVGVWAAGNGTSSPVNWRLRLPAEWVDDVGRRRRAAIPDHATADTLLDCLVGAVGEAADRSGGLERPAVIDARLLEAPTLVHLLRAAGMPFLLRIEPGQPLKVTDSAMAGCMPAVQRAARILVGARYHARPVRPQDRPAEGAGVGLAAVLRVEGPFAPGRELRLLGIGQGKRWPSEVWLTDLTDTRLSELVELAGLLSQVDRDFATADRLGVRDFTGRSYSGWNRHVTLVSAANIAAVQGIGVREPLTPVSIGPIAQADHSLGLGTQSMPQS
ncbi:transposase [Streptomyces sp. Lzd4kr]|nr:transposase [Streptomyces sp. Lzd4kr]